MINSKFFSGFANYRIICSKIFCVAIFVLALFSHPYIPSDGILETSMDWLGYLLVIVCVLGRIYCSIFLSGRKTLELVSSGPFSLVRNPLYVFSFLGILGVALQSSTITIPILFVIAFFLYYPSVVKTEEQRLLNAFGAPYEQYLKEVPRWFPRTLKMKMPTILTTDPKIVLKSIRDASLFFLCFPALELLETLHDTVLPTFWSII